MSGSGRHAPARDAPDCFDAVVADGVDVVVEVHDWVAMGDDQFEFVADPVCARGVLAVADGTEFVRAGSVADVGFALDDGPGAIDCAGLGARVRGGAADVLIVQHRGEDCQRRLEIRIDRIILFAADFEILGVHEDIAADLDVRQPASLVINVIGAGAAAAEDVGSQAGLLQQFESFRGRRHGFQGSGPARREAGDMLRGAVVAEHASEAESGELIDKLGQAQGRLSRRCAGAAHAGIDVYNNVGHQIPGHRCLGY